jgi:putative protease
VDLGGRQYLLSPQDLAGIEVLPDLVRAGVASLKIEGRLKSPEYVASITRVYRQALDRLKDSTPATPSRGERYELEMAFSRGLFTGWFRGIDNQKLVHAEFGKKRGVFVGEITGTNRANLLVRLSGDVKPGDGVVIDTGTADDHEQGGRVYAVHARRDGTAELEFRTGQLDTRRIQPGDRLWKTSDPELEKRIRSTFEGEAIRYQRPVQFEVHGALGTPLTVIVRDELGHVAQLASAMPLIAAEKRPLTQESLSEQLGRLGGTPFKLGSLENRLEGNLLLPLAELNRLRRELVAELERQRKLPKRWTLNPPDAGAISVSVAEASVARDEPELIVLVRSLSQLEAALRCGARTVYCDFEDPKKYREAVRTFHEAFGCRISAGGDAAPSIWVAPPRIFKPGEEWILQQVRSANADGYLVRNYDHLEFFAGQRLRGDFSLNVANPLTAEHFLKLGLERVTASYDLNAEQLASLLQSAPPSWFEITLHQHMPMFHMEHCVFCTFLSSGKDFRDCGRPCDKHEVRLRDRVGMEHPLKADSGCRNTVFNARAQTGAEFAGRFVELGVRHFRIEFVDETPSVVEKTLASYRALLRGELSGAQLWRELKLHSQLGVTRGQLDQHEARKVIPKNVAAGSARPAA